RLDYRRAEDRRLNLMHEPPRRCSHVQPALVKNRLLARPIASCRVAPNGRVDGQVRATAATGLPPVALEGVRTMSAEKPGVVQCNHDGNVPTQPGQRSQV